VSCATRRDELLEYELGALDGPARAELEAHLASGCPTCAGHLAEARAVVAHLPLALPSIAPPPDVRRSLLDRAGRGATVVAFERGRPSRRDWGRPLAAALLAAAATYVVVVVPLRESQSQLERSIDAQKTRIETLGRELEGMQEAARLLRSRRLELNVLASTEGRAESWARLLRDEEAGVWQLYAFGLAALPSDRTYELWFITDDDRKVPAGTFEVAADGRASHRVSVPAGLGRVVAAAVTDEPAGGSAQPTGTIRLVATLGRAAGSLPCGPSTRSRGQRVSRPRAPDSSRSFACTRC